MGMATIIEPGLIGSERVKRVCYLTGLDEDAVMGKLVRLWESSQGLKMVSASADQIGFWLRAPSKEKASEWVLAWADRLAGFLTIQEDGSYYIEGNAKHIEKKTAMSEANRKRALRRWQANEKTEDRPPGPGAHAGGVPDDMPGAAASDAYTILDSTELDSTLREPISASSDDGRKETFEKIFSSYPKRNGGICKSEGIKICLRYFKSQEQIEKLRRSVENYARYCEAGKKTGTEWVMQIPTFLRKDRWLEYAETRTNAPKVVVRTMEDLR